jgi:hypothetical protein
MNLNFEKLDGIVTGIPVDRNHEENLWKVWPITLTFGDSGIRY